LNTQNIFYKFFNLAVILQKEKIALLKKKGKRAGAADAGQAGPDPRPARASAGRTGTPPSDSDRMARGPSSLRDRHVCEPGGSG
jgi:hypothetical protein